MRPPSDLPSPIVPLSRTVTVEEWEAGRAPRRTLSMQVTGGQPLRRKTGDPRKDALLRRLFAGERGLPFGPIQPPCK